MRSMTLFFALLFLSLGLSASEKCAKPTPPSIPDGKKATENELLDTMDAVKAHVTRGKKYRECLDGKIEANLASEKPDPNTDKKLTSEYNASVEADEALSAQFNKEIKAFKSKAKKAD